MSTTMRRYHPDHPLEWLRLAKDDLDTARPVTELRIGIEPHSQRRTPTLSKSDRTPSNGAGVAGVAEVWQV